MTLPVEIYSTASVRRIDRKAIDESGIAGYTLMTRAAEAALQVALAGWPRARRWQVVCGGGNNGGDGYVLARLAARQGIDVSVIALRPPEALEGDAATACRDFLAAGGSVAAWQGTLDADAALLVDAMLGSGLERPLEGAFADAVAAMSRHAAPILALDIPSGLSGDTGRVLGCAVAAQRTITFVGLKSGLFLEDGPDFVGELHFDPLAIPASCREAIAAELRRIDSSAIGSRLAPRKRSAHKGDFGHLLLVGGGPGMAGAIRLSGDAALRCGAGRVSVATAAEQCAAMAAARPELMCHACDDASDLEGLLERVTTVAIGPGLGTDDRARALLQAVMASGLPLVVDADGLNLLAADPVARNDWILTPHPGEAARLLGTSPRAVQADRRQAVRELQRRYGGVAVLKGAGTLVSAAAEVPPWLCTAGNPGMAAPGIGDVLTGVIGSLLAQGLSAEDAAVTGVEVHARAGDAAAGEAPRGLMATDLLAELRAWVNP